MHHPRMPRKHVLVRLPPPTRALVEVSVDGCASRVGACGKVDVGDLLEPIDQPHAVMRRRARQDVDPVQRVRPRMPAGGRRT